MEKIRKIWDKISSPLSYISKALAKTGLYPLELEESNRFLFFILIAIVGSFLVYFATNSTVAWAILFGGGQIYSFLHEFFYSIVHKTPYNPGMGFAGIAGLAVGGIIAILLYELIFGLGGAIINSLFK